MSFVDDVLTESILSLIERLKGFADATKQDALPAVMIFRRNNGDRDAIVTPFDTDEETFEDALIRTAYRLHCADENQMYWVGVVCESYGVMKNGVLEQPLGDIEPGQLEKDFKENAFSEVTEAVTVFLANEDGKCEFLFFPYSRNDMGEAVFAKPYVRSEHEPESITEVEGLLLNYQEALRKVRSGEFDEMA